jgi:hypothetical protein
MDPDSPLRTALVTLTVILALAGYCAFRFARLDAHLDRMDAALRRIEQR